MTEHNPDNAASFESEGASTPKEESYESTRPPRRDRDRDRPYARGGRSGGERRPYGERRRSYEEPQAEIDPRIAEMIRETEEKLSATYHPVQVENLNPFERKQFHQHFERRKSLYQTKTYRREEDHVLWVFPVANLKKFLEEKAQEAQTSGASVALPPMSNYERFLAHSLLKEIGTVETASAGEGEERHITIQPKKIEIIQPEKMEAPSQFGRGLRKIAKKIKLMK